MSDEGGSGSGTAIGPLARAAALESISRLLKSSLGGVAALTETARILALGLADCCSFDLVTSEGQWRRVVVATVDPSLAEINAEIFRLFPVLPDDLRGAAEVHRTGTTLMIDRVTDDDLRSLAQNQEHYKRLCRLAAHSYLCVPIARDVRKLGVVTLIRTSTKRSFTREDAAAVEEIAELIAPLAAEALRSGSESPQGKPSVDPRILSGSELLTSSQALSSFLELTDDSIVVTSPEGRVVYWNRAAEETYGWTLDEVIGQPLHVLLRSEIPAAPSRILDELRDAGRWRGEVVNYRRDGSQVIASCRLFLHRDEAGAPAAILLAASDMTEHYRARTQLQEAYEREHKIAEALQRSMLVDIRDKQFGDLTIIPIYQAAWDEALVGGDFYDVCELRRDVVAIIVGDVSGKGLAAAQYTSEVKFATRAYLCEDDDPAGALERLNRYALRSQRMQQQDMTMFVAMTIVIVDSAARTARIAAAGMEPPMVLRRDGTVEAVNAGGKPIGLFDDECYEAVEIELERGETMLLVTDGITEARNETAVLGFDGLMLLAKLANRHRPLRELADAIMNDTRQFVGGRLHDNTCLVLARIE